MIKITCDKCKNIEILVVPDLRAMNKAINDHVKYHRNRGCNNKICHQIAEHLTQQLLIVSYKPYTT